MKHVAWIDCDDAKNLHDAARIFARQYWDKPREIERVIPLGGRIAFTTENGTHTYYVTYVDRRPHSRAGYSITREDT